MDFCEKIVIKKQSEKSKKNKKNNNIGGKRIQKTSLQPAI